MTRLLQAQIALQLLEAANDSLHTFLAEAVPGLDTNLADSVCRSVNAAHRRQSSIVRMLRKQEDALAPPDAPTAA